MGAGRGHVAPGHGPVATSQERIGGVLREIAAAIPRSIAEWRIPDVLTPEGHDAFTAFSADANGRKWAMAAVVAAHVTPGSGQGARTTSAKSSRGSMSASDFAARGYIGLGSKDTVLAYLRAWEASGQPTPTPGDPLRMPVIEFKEARALAKPPPLVMLPPEEIERRRAANIERELAEQAQLPDYSPPEAGYIATRGGLLAAGLGMARNDIKRELREAAEGIEAADVAEVAKVCDEIQAVLDAIRALPINVEAASWTHFKRDGARIYVLKASSGREYHVYKSDWWRVTLRGAASRAPGWPGESRGNTLAQAKAAAERHAQTGAWS